MSIKFLQDQQLNQIQRSPMDSPWAKLVAQSEMLDRSKLRQPQGQAPQGTVADDIQQALIAAQQNQAQQMQNVPLDKAQLIAQLVNSGHFAAGGLTQSSPYSQMMGSSPYNNSIKMGGATPTYIPPESQDAAAQAKKHGMLQSMLDNSIIGMVQGKANIGNALQDYADLFTGKMFSRGFATGGETLAHDYAASHGRAQELARMRGNLSEQDLALRPYIKAAEDRAARLRAVQQAAANAQRVLPAPGPMSASNLEAILRGNADAQDFIDYLKSKQLATTTPQASNPPEIQKLLEGPRSSGALPYITQVSESPELQEYYKKLYGAKPVSEMAQKMADKGYQGYTKTPTPPDEMLQKMGATFRAQQEAAARAQQEAEAARKPISEMAQKMADKGFQGSTRTPLPTSEMASKMESSAGYTPPEIKPDAWGAGESPYRTMPEAVEKGLGAVKQGLGSLGRGAGKALSAASPIGDLMAAGEITGDSIPLLLKAAGVNAPSNIGGVPVSQGSPSQIAMDLFSSPTARLSRVGSDLADAGQYVSDKATSAYDQFKNRLHNTPSVPQVDLSQYGVDINDKIPGQPTVQDFSKGAPYANAATQKPSVSTGTTINKVPQTAKAPITDDNTKVINATHGQDTQPTSNPVVNAATTHAAVAQADQAISKSAGEEGQGSILDSLYNKLKDTDVDYSDLAKRISQNEYDLARERKDGTFNAILGGIGAALKQAGTYEEAGGRVFKPGIGAIAGSGILGGLKLSEEADKKYAEGNRDNTLALLKLKELKGKSLNDVLDAISAQKQVEAMSRGQDIQQGHWASVAANQERLAKAKEDYYVGQLGHQANQDAMELAKFELLARKDPASTALFKQLKAELDDASKGVDQALRTFDPAAIAEAKAKHDEVLRRFQALGTGTASGAGGQPQKTLEDYRNLNFKIEPQQ